MTAAFAVLCIGILVIAAWYDIAVRAIPNRLAVILAFGGAGLRLSHGLDAMVGSLVAGGMVFVALFLLWLLRGLGGGDVKLASAAAIGLPMEQTIFFLFLVTSFGLFLAAVFAIVGRGQRVSWVYPAGRGRNLLVRVGRAEWRRLRRRGPLPYGVAISAGGVAMHLTTLGV